MIRRAWLGLIAAMVFLGGASTQAQPVFDGLKVTFCGTSGPLPVRDRAKPCLAVQAGGSLFLVDIGPEATENLQLWRLPLDTAKAVFITHLHSDHIGDLGEFNMQSWVAGRPAPLLVIGPPGVDRLAKGFNEAYALDHGYRNAHHEHDDIKLPIAAGLLKAKVVAPPKSGTVVVWNEGGLTVTAIVVKHDPATPAYGYRFDYKGRSFVVSGDTKKWPPLADAAKGADLIIHEAQNPDMTRTMAAGLAGQGNKRMSSIMADTLSYHTSPEEAAEIARAAGVKALVLTHLTQAGLPFYNAAAFTKGMDAGGPLDWRLAKDGMTIELPAGSKDIRFGQL
ncbi:MBL fold metallo-hydrolase [soil metagenome]